MVPIQLPKLSSSPPYSVKPAAWARSGNLLNVRPDIPFNSNVSRDLTLDLLPTYVTVFSKPKKGSTVCHSLLLVFTAVFSPLAVVSRGKGLEFVPSQDPL
jgi:hypothetical protein